MQTKDHRIIMESRVGLPALKCNFVREREFISQMNKQINQIQISTVAGYQ